MSVKLNKMLAVVLCIILAFSPVAAAAEDGAQTPATYAEVLQTMDQAAVQGKLNEFLSATGVVLTDDCFVGFDGGNMESSLKSVLNAALPDGTSLSDGNLSELMHAVDETEFKAVLVGIFEEALAAQAAVCSEIDEDEPAADEPAEPAADEPADPAADEPAEPAADKPADPDAKDPADPDATDPADPDAKDPADPDAKDPADPDAKDPADPDAKDPADPDAKDPEDPNAETDDPALPQCTCKASEEEKAAEGFEHEITCPLCTLPFYDRLLRSENLDTFYKVAAMMKQEDFDVLSEEQANEIAQKETALYLMEFPEDESPEPDTQESEPLKQNTVHIPAVDCLWPGPFMPPVAPAYPMMRTFSLMPFENTASDSGLALDKRATYDPDTDMAHITLEAYATGESIITSDRDVPVDIILVLDESGSMSSKDMITSESYTRYEGSNRQNQKLYEHRENGGDGSLYYQLEDGSYIGVSVVRQKIIPEDSYTYSQLKTDLSNSKYYNKYNNNHNLYAVVGGAFVKVIVEKSGRGTNAEYTYKLENGVIIAESKGYNTVPTFTNVDPKENALYERKSDNSKAFYRYIYSYTDAGITTEIGTSDTEEREFEDVNLYRKLNTTVTRIESLKNALTAFMESVHAKANGYDGEPMTADDINHRIAVVGFGSGENLDYENTEMYVGPGLMIGSQNTTDDPYINYGNIGEPSSGADAPLYAPEYAFQSMDTQEGRDNIAAALNGLDASGATQADLGLDMALKILDANPVVDQERNRVVIIFTDGAPTSYNGFEGAVANSAINYANQIKARGATVYSIGIFQKADGTTFKEYEDNKPPAKLEDPKSDSSVETQTKFADACNWTMHKISSNTVDGATSADRGYYLTAKNAKSLSDIFQHIAGNIEGGSSTMLNQEAVIRDAVAPHFNLPADAKISVSTVYATDIDANGNPVWADSGFPLDTAVVTNDGNNNISVKGFNYSKYWVGLETKDGVKKLHPDAQKLVIEFDVKRSDTFLGGDNVYTNGSGLYADGGTGAYIYENSGASDPVGTFPTPDVEVTMNSTIGKASEEIFLGQEAHLDQLSHDVMYTEDGKLYVRRKTIDGEMADCLLDGMNNQYVDVTYYIYAENDTAHAGDPIGTLTVPAGQPMESAVITWTGTDMPNPPDLAVGDHPFPVTVVLTPAYPDPDNNPNGAEESDPDGELLVKVKAGCFTLTKTVTGSMGDYNQPFNFTATVGERNLNVVNEQGSPDGLTQDVILRHNESCLMGTVVPGDVITVSERNLDYTLSYAEITYTHADQSVTVETVNEIQNSEGTASFQFTLPEDMKDIVSVTVNVFNNREGSPDTGVVLDSLPYVLMLVIASAAVVILIVRKHRTEEE